VPLYYSLEQLHLFLHEASCEYLVQFVIWIFLSHFDWQTGIIWILQIARNVGKIFSTDYCMTKPHFPLLAAALASPSNNLAKCDQGASKLLKPRYVSIADFGIAQQWTSKYGEADI